MKNRLMMLLAFLAVFTLSAPALAAPPEGDTAAAEETKDDAAKDDAKSDEKADGETGEAPKADVGGDSPDADTGDTGAAADDGDKPAELETDDEAVDAAKDLFSALQQKQWALALGLALSLLVFGLRKVKVLDKVPSKMVPWLTAALGVATYMGAALMVDGADLVEALLGGAMTGAAAVGLWEMVLKHLLGKKAAE